MSRQRGIEQARVDVHAAREALRILEEKALRIIGREAVAWIEENFDKQGYDGSPWQKRSPATNKAYDKRYGVKGSVFSSENPILKQTGNLKDSIRYKVNGVMVFVGFNTDRVPYGRVHNEGGNIYKQKRTVILYFGRGKQKGKFAAKQKGKTRIKKKATIPFHAIRMPKRQFMPKPGEPENPKIVQRAVKLLIFERDKILRKFAVK